MSQSSYDVDRDDVDDLETDLENEELLRPGSRARVEQLTEVIRVATTLWQRREAIGMTEDQVAERSGLTMDEVASVEDNAVDVSFDVLRRYAAAVGLQFELQQVPA